MALARFASARDLTQKAEQLWLRVAKVPAARREALDALYALYRETNDLPNLHLTAQRLHESSPDEIALAANAARFALLLDRNTAAGRALAQQAYEKSPNDPAAALTYAFALYGTGRTPEAIAIVEKLPSEKLDDPHTAVYAALLYDDAGQLEIANKYIEQAKAATFTLKKNSSWKKSPLAAKTPATRLTNSPLSLARTETLIAETQSFRGYL